MVLWQKGLFLLLLILGHEVVQVQSYSILAESIRRKALQAKEERPGTETIPVETEKEKEEKALQIGTYAVIGLVFLCTLTIGLLMGAYSPSRDNLQKRSVGLISSSGSNVMEGTNGVNGGPDGGKSGTKSGTKWGMNLKMPSWIPSWKNLTGRFRKGERGPASSSEDTGVTGDTGDTGERESRWSRFKQIFGTKEGRQDSEENKGKKRGWGLGMSGWSERWRRRKGGDTLEPPEETDETEKGQSKLAAFFKSFLELQKRKKKVKETKGRKDGSQILSGDEDEQKLAAQKVKRDSSKWMEKFQTWWNSKFNSSQEPGEIDTATTLTDAKGDGFGKGKRGFGVGGKLWEGISNWKLSMPFLGGEVPPSPGIQGVLKGLRDTLEANARLRPFHSLTHAHLSSAALLNLFSPDLLREMDGQDASMFVDASYIIMYLARIPAPKVEDWRANPPNSMDGWLEDSIRSMFERKTLQQVSFEGPMFLLYVAFAISSLGKSPRDVFLSSLETDDDAMWIDLNSRPGSTKLVHHVKKAEMAHMFLDESFPDGNLFPDKFEESGSQLYACQVLAQFAEYIMNGGVPKNLLLFSGIEIEEPARLHFEKIDAGPHAQYIVSSLNYFVLAQEKVIRQAESVVGADLKIEQIEMFDRKFRELLGLNQEDTLESIDWKGDLLTKSALKVEFGEPFMTTLEQLLTPENYPKDKKTSVCGCPKEICEKRTDPWGRL